MRLRLFLLPFFMLVGCEPLSTIEDDFSDYLSRIANVQQQDALPSPLFNAQSLPEKRDLLIAIEPLTMGLLDSYELRQCGLFTLIAERNSILGKVQDEFREWDYQVALLAGIEHCLNGAQLNAELQQQLLSIQKIKQQQLPSHWHNLLYTSVTMRSQLSGSQWYDEQWDSSELILALEQLNTIEQQVRLGLAIDPISLSSQQEVLEKQRVIGNLKFSLDRATAWLTALTQQLENHDQSIICGTHRDTTKLKYLRNVFQSQYVEKIQPYLALLDGVYYHFSPKLRMFEQSDSPFSIQASHQNFRSAIQVHAQYWQRLFKRCNLVVGQHQ